MPKRGAAGKAAASDSDRGGASIGPIRHGCLNSLEPDLTTSRRCCRLDRGGDNRKNELKANSTVAERPANVPK